MADESSRYLTWLAGGVVAFGIIVISVVVAVDPYRAFALMEIEGFNAIKPRIYQQADLAKRVALDRFLARTLFLGNSRVEIGFDPMSQAIPEAVRPAFNAGQAGAGYRTSLQRLHQALRGGELLQVIVGLDFQDFLVPPSAPEPADLASWSGSPVWAEKLRLTVSIDAVADAAATLLGQDPHLGITMNIDGFNPLRDYRIHVGRIGHHGLFADRLSAYGRDYSRRVRPDFSRPESNASYRLVRSIVRLAALNNVKVIAFVHPYHQEYMQLLDRLGMRVDFDRWHSMMRALIAAEGHVNPGAVRLVEFADLSSFSTEPVPPAGDRRTEMRWYWEAGHYKSALGDELLRRMFSSPGD